MANVEFTQCLSGQVHPILKGYVINNSATIKRGDFVRLDTSGNAVRGTATANLLGGCMGVVDANGAPVAPDSGTEDTWTVASDNETVAMKKALVNVDPTAIYEVDFSAAIGTTGGSAAGARFDLTDHDTVNEASATTSSAQVALVEAVPGSTTRGRVVIVENQILGS